MGSLLGGVIGGVGGLISGSSQASGEKYAANKAAETARLGFDYLKGSPVGTQYLPTGASSNNAIAALLGVGGDATAANNAFQGYNNSTGLNFQLQEGQKAVTTNAASRGLLNSGATLKALTKYGQNLGSTSFNNYLTQLGGLATRGLSAGAAIGGAGSQAGATGADAISKGYGAAAGTQGAALAAPFGAASNYFSSHPDIFG